MQPSSDTAGSGRNNLKRYGPLAIIVVLVLVVVVVAIVAKGGSDNNKSGSADGTDSGVPSGKPPAGAISYNQAKKEGKLAGLNFPNCNKDLGTVAIPSYFAAECFADVKDNGGATSPGVTADTINVVVYLAQENDAVINYITSAIKNNDTNAQAAATYQGYTDLFNSYYQTYGRKVKLTIMEASGGSQDEVAARADAVKAAEQYHAFAVWGGPVLTSAFADELASRGVICIACTGGAPSFFEKRAPYLYTVTANQDQLSRIVNEYVEKKLNGRNAVHAGDALKDKPRKFGLLYIESNDDSKKSADAFTKRLEDKGIKLAATVPYELDPGRLQEEATSAIAKMKSAGVTTVIFSGDPVAPATFTKEATAQDWYPEWVLGPNQLVDVTAFARTYDQKQWQHAFGPSPLAARVVSTQGTAYILYKWFTGKEPPAIDTYQVEYPNPATFFAGVQSAGPDLTPEHFQQGMFSLPPRANAISQPTISYGDHGFWPFTDYNGIDNETEIWWNPTATGPDEIRKEGTGMYEYVDGGKRYLPGQWTTAESKVFDPNGAITILDQVPADEQPPDYPSPAKGG